MSQIEQIGTRLYGESWQAQLAKQLINQEGQSITRQTVQGWHKKDRVPIWAIKQLIELTQNRAQEILEVRDMLHAALNGTTN